ncbi:hypothetical protein PFISCL1PPCAC_7161, partial [Pristionchus fissidentatus]
ISPAMRSLIERFPSRYDEFRWAELLKMDPIARRDELENDASVAVRRGREERLFTHFIMGDWFTLVAPFTCPPYHRRMKFPLNQEDLHFISMLAPSDWLHHLHDKNGFDELVRRFRFQGSEYRASVLLKRAVVYGER